MFDLFKKIIENGLLSLLNTKQNDSIKANVNENLSNVNENLSKSNLTFKQDPKKSKELEIAKQKAREIQNRYKKDFSKIEKIRAERRDLEEKGVSLKNIAKEKAQQLENERYQEKILLEVKRKKLEEEKRLQEEAEEYRQNIFKRYEENPDGSLKIEDHNDFLRIIEGNQNAISEVDHKYIRDFVRISTLLESKAALIQKYFSTLKNPKNNDWINLLKNTNWQLKSEIEIYKKTLAISLAMVSALISKDMIAFYKIYEQFDSNGLFDNRHEKLVQESLSNINKNLGHVNENLNQLQNTISNKLEDLDKRINKVAIAIYEMDYMIGDNFDRLNSRIKFELDKVNSSINYPKLIENLAPLAPAAGLVAGYQLGYSLTGPPKK